MSADGKERLQKVLAAAGLGSRRDCEELIVQGRVEVDRQVVSELGSKVDPLSQEVRVDGVALPRPKRHYFVVNKPAGVVCTNWDPSGRPRVIDLVPTPDRVFAVGRLDRGSEGLILVTNDGALAHQVTHPRFGVEKTYAVRVEGTPDVETIARLKRGVWISEGRCRVRSLIVKKRMRNCCDLLVVLDEGKNREIRRVMAKIGHKVLRLRRIAIGGLRLGDLPLGAARKLHPNEIDGLLESARESRRERAAERKTRIAEKKLRAKSETQTQTPAAFPKPKRPSTPGVPKPLDLDELLNVRGPYRVTEEDAPSDDEMIEVASPGATPIGDVIDYDEPAPENESSETPSPRPRGDHPRGGRPNARGRTQGTRPQGARPQGARPQGGRPDFRKKKAFGQNHEPNREQGQGERSADGPPATGKRPFKKKGAFNKSGFKKPGFSKFGGKGKRPGNTRGKRPD